jgi:hypothetical protein
MDQTRTKPKGGTTVSTLLLPILVAALISVASAGPQATAATPADGQEKKNPEMTATTTEAAAEASQAETIQLAAQWGIEVTSVRLTAADHMIDYRYRVLDTDKATDLFKRQIKPFLIHQETGKVLAVPETAKIGPLRNSNIPQEGKIYWMFFGNAGNLVKAGDKITVVIGEFRVEDLIIE